MMMKIFDRISKIFFAFICFIVILGMIFLSVRNYTTPIVSYTALSYTDKIKSTNYFSGKVLLKDANTIEIKASQDMDISRIGIRADQIVASNEFLFNLDINNALNDKIDEQDIYNDKLYNANAELNTLLKQLGKKVNKEIASINNINPYDGIAILATSSGKIKNLSIEEGEKVNSPIIATIEDDGYLKISFKMTPNEYPTMSVGQNILVTFTGYEGYYEAKVKSINPNSVPDKDKISFVYNGVIEAKNPGLIYPGVNVSVSTQVNGQPASTLTNAGVVESYMEQNTVATEIYSNSGRDVYATEVNVIEGEYVEKGQIIATIGGKDVVNEITADIKKIKDKMKLISETQKDMQGIYGNIIYSNIDHKIAIDENGNCTIPEKIYIDYITNNSTVRKDEVILRYHSYSISDLEIKASIDLKTHKILNRIGDKVYYGLDSKDLTTKAVLESKKEFSKNYELTYAFQESDVGKLSLNDNVIFKFDYEENATNVVPKTAIIPIGKIAVGSSGYVYVINSEDSILGNVDVLEEKKVTIVAVGDDKVAIEFDKNYFTGFKDIFVVNYINSTLEDGMRVKTK